VALVEEPWDADLMAPGDDPAERQATFGEGYGLLSFHVDDATVWLLPDLRVVSRKRS
jgi:hypothetical protein